MNSLPTMEQTAHKASRAKLGLLEFIIVAVILLNAGYWRLYHIDYRAMWYDEVEVVRVAQLPTITDVIEGARSHMSAPPVDYLLRHFWQKAGGVSASPST